MTRIITFEKDNKFITEKFITLEDFRDKYPKERLVKVKYDYDGCRYADEFVPIPGFDGYSFNINQKIVYNRRHKKILTIHIEDINRPFVRMMKDNSVRIQYIDQIVDSCLHLFNRL